MTSRRRIRLSRVLLPVVALGLAAVAVLGLRPGTVDEASPEIADPNALSPGSAAMRAHINPETGELEIRAGLPEELLDANTRKALSRDAEGLEQVFHPDGSASIDLQGRFQNASVATIGKDGAVVICSSNADHVHDVLDGEPSRTAKPEVQ